MDAAILLIAVMALVASTASLTLQFTLWKLGAKEKAPTLDPFTDTIVTETPTMALPSYPKTREAIEAQKIIKDAELDRLNEAFANPDVPFTGIDEEFDT